MSRFTDLWTIKMGDWERGLIVAVLTSPITIVLDSVNTGSLVFDWKKVLAGAIAGGLAYILKNLITGSQGNILKNS